MSSTSLGSSFGLETDFHPEPARRTDRDPEEFIQDYIDDPVTPEPRNHLDGTVLVSGLVQHAQANDQAVFDLLNQEHSWFRFDRILAFVDNIELARKQLLSRSARYTGLLDKLRFVQSNTTRGIPTQDQLEHVSSWVAYIEGKDLLGRLEEVTTVAKEVPSLRNLVVLVADAVGLSQADSSTLVQKMEATGKSFTLVAVGVVKDEPEGLSPYKYIDLKLAQDNELPKHAVFSRKEAFRIAIDSLQLNSAVNKALYFQEVAPEHVDAKLIRGLREAGYTRTQEIDYMIRGGPQKYERLVSDFKKKVDTGRFSNSTMHDSPFGDRQTAQDLALLLPDRFWEHEGWNETKLWKDFRHADIHRIAREMTSSYIEDAHKRGELTTVTEPEFYKATEEAALNLATALHEREIRKLTTNEENSSKKSKIQRHKDLVWIKRLRQNLQKGANLAIDEEEFDEFFNDWASPDDYIPRDVPFEEFMKVTKIPDLNLTYVTPFRFDPNSFNPNLDDRTDYRRFNDEEEDAEFLRRLEAMSSSRSKDDDDDDDSFDSSDYDFGDGGLDD